MRVSPWILPEEFGSRGFSIAFRFVRQTKVYQLTAALDPEAIRITEFAAPLDPWLLVMDCP